MVCCLSGGGAEKQADRQVRTQEKEAECNHGRTTCHPAWGGPSGSSRSGGPGSLPVDPACGCCGSVKVSNHLLLLTKSFWQVYLLSSCLKAFWRGYYRFFSQKFGENRQVSKSCQFTRISKNCKDTEGVRFKLAPLSLTWAWSVAWGNRCALDSPPPPLPRGTGDPSPSSPWPQSAGWIPPQRMGC